MKLGQPHGPLNLNSKITNLLEPNIPFLPQRVHGLLVNGLISFRLRRGRDRQVLVQDTVQLLQVVSPGLKDVLDGGDAGSELQVPLDDVRVEQRQRRSRGRFFFELSLAQGSVGQLPDSRLSDARSRVLLLVEVGLPVGEDVLDRRLDDLPLLDEQELLLSAALHFSQPIVADLLLGLVLLAALDGHPAAHPVSGLNHIGAGQPGAIKSS